MNTPKLVIPSVILSADRSVLYRPPNKLPEWAISWEFPDFQSTNRLKIDLGIIGAFPGIFDGTGIVSGRKLLDVLLEEHYIDRCLNLSDGISIATYEYCYSIFKGRRVFLWQSVVHDNQQNLFVPFIQNIRGQMPIIYWFLLGYNINLAQSLGLLE